ncbi:MAG TPA: YCF48-related protein, partial [Gillisia sp.]|nr:YCF48-related protein [Gillisia sp.]
MKKLVDILLFTSSLIMFQCSNEIPITNDPINLELGKVSLRIDKENAPDEVVLVEAFLTREEHDTLYGNLNLVSSTSADILFEDVAAGEWHIKVDAKDSSGVVLYTGETNVNILAGVLTQVNLTLVLTGHGTGSIFILVNWGTSNLQWEQINSPTQTNLNCVYVLNSSISFIGGDNGKVFKTLDGCNTWLDISPQTSVGFYSIYFVDENHGWVGGREGTIARTTNGGNPWNINSVYSSNIHNIVESIYFFDSNTGYISGGFVLPDRQTFIYKTLDGGINWNLQLNLYGGVLFELSFINQDNGYVVGTNGGVFKTTNSGNTWEDCFVNTGYWLR